MRKYPDAFLYNPYSLTYEMKKKYCGIADILNGLSAGRILYGYGHDKDYWANRNNIGLEGWAQFGRIQFENDTMVMELLEELFPSFTKDAILALKGVEKMWKGEITEELREVSVEYAKKHNGMYPDGYIQINYDNMPYEYFLAKIKEANKKNCSIVDLME